MIAKIIVVAASLLLVIFLSEIYAQRYLNIPYFTFDHVAQELDSELTENKMLYDLELGYRQGPTWSGKNGIYGFQNGREYVNSKEMAKDIVLLGDSIIQERYLEKSLKYLLRKGYYRIWNAGIGNYNTMQEAYYLEKFTGIIPDILVLGFCINDFSPSYMIVSNKHRFAYRLYGTSGYVNELLFIRSALYRYMKNRMLTNRGEWWNREMVQNNKDLVRKGIERMRKYCRDNKSNFIVIIYPHLKEPIEWEKEAHAAILQILQDLKVSYVDLHQVYDKIGFENLRIRENDSVHPNNRGHSIAAKMLIKQFPENFAVKKEESIYQ